MRRRRSFWSCAHSTTITTITAGLAREVCEECGDVSVSYVERAVRLDPGFEEADLVHPGSAFEATPDESGPDEARVFEAMVTFEESSRLLTCGLCSQQAVFMIPDGLRCDEHAWQAAARLDWDTVDPWVPIRIHRSTRHG